jgi:phage terminase large subunit-like protein
LTHSRDLLRNKRHNQLFSYRPYPKQVEFHAAGAEHRERLLIAGNQLGKTLAGSMEWAMHLTGLYQDWWQGRRFDGPVRLWATGETRVSTRDTVQKLLIGPPEQEDAWGTGAIPGKMLRRIRRSAGLSNGIDSVTVKHVTGFTSTLLFKSYEQGRAAWQGETLHGVWFDEEPPLDVYIEGLTRTNATGGIVMLTFTPLKGLSEVVRMYLSDSDLHSLGPAAGQ